MIFVAVKRLLHHLSFCNQTANTHPSLRNFSTIPDEENHVIKFGFYITTPNHMGHWGKIMEKISTYVTDDIQVKKFSTSSIIAIRALFVSAVISEYKWKSHSFHSTCCFLGLIQLSLESTLKPSEQPKELNRQIDK